MSLQEELEDGRTLREYLRDVEETEAKGLYPEYSARRRRILAYWTRAVERGWVSLDDPIQVAIRKMRKS